MVPYLDGVSSAIEGIIVALGQTDATAIIAAKTSLAQLRAVSLEVDQATVELMHRYDVSDKEANFRRRSD